MKKHICLAFVLIVTTGLSAGAQLIFPDATQQDTAGITFDRVKVIHSDGSDTANGTALRNELAAQASSQTVDVLLLEPGFYNVGSTALSMVDGVSVQGFGQKNTVITGSGANVVKGASFMDIRDLKIEGNGNASTVLLQNGGSMNLVSVVIQHNGSGTGSNFGVRVINGGDLELKNSEILFFQNGNSGSFVGLLVVGDDIGGEFSNAFMENCAVEISDDSGTMTLTAVAVGDNTTTPAMDESVEVEILGGFIEAEGGSSSTGLFIDSDGNAFLSGACIETTGAALDNDGFCGAINSVFGGTRGGVGTTIYSQSTAITISSAAPIIDTETAIP